MGFEFSIGFEFLRAGEHAGEGSCMYIYEGLHMCICEGVYMYTCTYITPACARRGGMRLVQRLLLPRAGSVSDFGGKN